MITAAMLLAAIALASGPQDYPARIGMTNTTLHDLARELMDSGSYVLEICSDLYDTSSTDPFRVLYYDVTDDDAKVIGFFLATATRRTVAV